VLKARTPFDGLSAPLFDITRDGAGGYTGALIKRGKPTQADYYLLKPGASHTVKVELSALYDMSVSGDYAIRYRTASPHLFLPTAHNGRHAGIGCRVAAGGKSAVSCSRTRRALHRRPPAARRLADHEEPGRSRRSRHRMVTAGPELPPCTSSQQTTIASAISAAQTMSNGAVTYMAKTTMGPRYTKWFGTVTSTRQSTVKSHYAASRDARQQAGQRRLRLQPDTTTPTCTRASRTASMSARPSGRAPMTGTDSKGGTLVHEMSHFNVVAGTDDHVPMAKAAPPAWRSAIRRRPIDNADSHEYFSENTPALQ
jgi:peptidyl-Lys metalloendopeptidase